MILSEEIIEELKNEVHFSHYQYNRDFIEIALTHSYMAVSIHALSKLEQLLGATFVTFSEVELTPGRTWGTNSSMIFRINRDHDND